MSKTQKSSTIPIYMKYSNSVSQNWLNPLSKLKPSDLVKPSIDVSIDDYPMIIEFNNMSDNTSNVHSIVDIDQPLFQPAPKIVVFEEYKPFTVVEKKLYFRNKDSVTRRIKIMKPDTTFFELSAPKSMNGEPLLQTKIASGMEIYFVITFKPQEVRDYSYDLICSTEREKFIVPIRAVGTRPHLTFPDEIDFGSFPIKSPSQRKISVQNIGNAVAKFNMRSSNSLFSCPTQDIAIEPGASESIEFYFTPADTEPVEGEIQIDFLKGVTCYIRLTGVGRNADVSLSTPSLNLEPSYISLLSQKSLRIRNNSDTPISYMWKSFSSERDEDLERSRLQQEINRMEDIEQSALRQRIEDGFYSNGNIPGENDYLEDNPSMYGSILGDTGDELNPIARMVVPIAAKSDQAALVRKYRNLRKALEKDNMQFVDDIFEITPIEGQVWAHSEIEIAVCFRPDTAALYNCLAYLDVSGREDRLPLQLSGQGIGPNATLSFEVLDMGDVFINDEKNYELKIKNRGDIPAQWTFMSSLTKFGNKFKFSPTEGYLKPGQSQTIAIQFQSDLLGEFSEQFRFSLQGNEDMLVARIKGHVIGPHFHFDVTTIDFGTVSYDYLHTTTVTLVNTSTILMDYSLHVPQDGLSFLKKEFNITPSQGKLLPGDNVEVLIEFIPSSVKVYNYSLSVDVLGVGDNLLSLPIIAECVVSSVKLELPSREIDFGDCFIRYPYEKTFLLTNLSQVVHTKFEIMPQLKQTKSVASFYTVPSIAVIEPGDTIEVKVNLTPLKLGPFKLPMTIVVAGSKEPPMQAVLQYNTIGPRVAVDVTELRWGNIECLKDSDRTIKLTNVGLTTAIMKLFLKMARSNYSLAVRELVLDAGQSFDLVVTANLDDCVVCKDEMHVVVDEGDSLMVPLIAKGIGTTMYCKQDVDILDLGVQLTNNFIEKQIILENKGRRPQQLRWYNRTIRTENTTRMAKAKKEGKDTTQPKRLPKHLMPLEPMFTITPEEITLRSRTATTFTFKCYSSIPRSINEIFVLESKVGKDRYMKEIMITDVRCDIVNPLLEFSCPSLDFVYTWVKDVPPIIQKKEITLTNNSTLVLAFYMKTEVPFNLNTWEAVLQPGEKIDVEVDFDPVYKDDKQSHIVEKSLSIHYRSHPQKDVVPMKAELIFPNLIFDQSAIQFGCVLNDTVKTMKLKATNSSKIPLNYEWLFIENAAPKAKGRGSVIAIAPSQVFDILPVRSMLNAGESEDVEFTLYGNANSKFGGNVICMVEGGPEYSFPISGEASTVSFELNRSIIDFGKVLFTEKAEEELEIMNHGKVPFNYRINPATNSGAQLLQVELPIGKVPPGQSVKVVIRVLPGIPISFCESLSVSIAHFDEFLVPCYCQGIFPSATVSLPRYRKVGPYGETENVNSEMWSNFHNQALLNITVPDSSVLPPVCLPIAASGNTALPPVYELTTNLPPHPPNTVDQDDNHSLDGGSSIQPASITSSVNTKGISLISIEMEMQKLVLVHQLQKMITNLQLNAVDNYDQSLLLQSDYNINSPRFGMQALVNKNINISEIVAANYICDFGNVIVGQTRKKIIKITNASFNGKLNWLFDKKYLSGSGFTIEPEQVTKMPEGTTLDFTIKFFARPNINIGQKVITLPLENRGSPTINIILNANVCIPDIELSSTNIDFGRLLIGRCMQMYISLYNPTPVTANWQFRKGGKDDNKFKIEPSSASLRPGKRMIVCIEFVPTDPYKYSMEVIVKIDQNKKTKLFNVFGEGFGTPLIFEPKVVELGPILPYTDGDEKIVTVINTSEVDIEVYSVDFDTIYHEEENKLTQLTSYDEQGLFRTSLRTAGNPLPVEIQDLYNQIQNNQEIITTTIPPVNDIIRSEDESVNVIEESPVFVLENAPIRTKPAFRDENLHQDILLFGPPISGISSHAIQMSKKLVVPVKTIDQIIDEIAMTNDPLYGYLARSCSNKLQPQELQEYKSKEEELLAIADQSKATAEETYKKANKKAKEVPPEVYQTPEVLAHKEYVNSRSVNVNTLAEMIKFRMSWIDMDRGVIIDGVMSKYIEAEIVINSFQIALPQAMITHISINRGEEGYTAWLNSLYNSKNDEIIRLKRAIESNKKTYKKLCKTAKKKGSPNAPMILALIDNNESIENTAQHVDDFPIVISEGDEIWINQATGLLVELESNDFKSLEELEKFKYLEQLFYQYSNEIKQNQKLQQTILKIWNPETGLRTRDDKAAIVPDENKISEIIPDVTDSNNEMMIAPLDNVVKEEEDLSNVIYYNEYVEKVLPVLTNLKVGTYGTISIATTNEEVLEEKKDEIPIVSNEEVESIEVQDSKPLVDNGGLYTILIDGDESENAVFANITAILPPPLIPPPDKDAVPPPLTFQVYRKPLQRHHRKPIKLFKILPIEISGDSTAETNNYRWIIPANSSIQFRVKFASIIESKPESTMEFEVVGTNQKFSLYCKGICELPKINSDSRNIFMRRAKGLNPNPLVGLPSKRFLIAENFYSFGPLNLFKKPDWKKAIENTTLTEADKLQMQQIESTNMDILRFTNNGLYKCDIDFGFTTKDEGSRDIFKVEPNKLELEEGETKEIKLWALPKEVKEYSNDLVISLTNNPMPIVYPLKCWGVEPTIEFSGPWNEGLEKAEKALAANTDKKLTKDLESKLAALKEALTIDFDRILIKKSDTRSFTIKNTCLLPIQWEIDLGDFKNSDNISIMPMSGVIPINTTEPILITFTSPDPLMLTGKFSLRYSDNEGGLKAESASRVITTTFRAVAEAFKITAVSLNSLGKEEGGSEIDYGLMRVGDNAVQTIKMGNKGKYQIAYEFKLTTPLINSLVRIEPMEGFIEAGTALAEIKVFYCSKDNELTLKNNKDIVVHIIEPVTKEVVEKFPLIISAQSKYSKFRLQPSKGISFGAVRFDSEAKPKRVELRNEGNFELTYVICAAQAEIEEIDSLDSGAFACYAQATPQAMRTNELGSNYRERLNGAGNAPVKGGKGKEKAPPAKGKGGAAPPISTSQLNPLVFDPDELAPGAALPEDPLVVGAFTVLPRIGTVQPGQSVGIDMKFDPSGCDTVKERLRLCVSGADPKDSLSQIIKSFEVTGESCVPAIITDDIYSIFEEQEVVHSLADSTGDKSSEGGGKIEKLPVGKNVYAETEKMLAFGPVSCNSQSRGVIERVRISNPTKIDIKVKFNILSPEDAAALGRPASANAKGKAPPAAKAGGKGAPVVPVANKPNVFTVQPERWEIPPHEFRFVNIYFNPTEIKSYRSVFKAMIDDGGIETSAVSKTPNSGKSLSFELAGSGTLPCIAFDEPHEFNSEGNLLINFNKVLANRSIKRKLILRNDGVMPATCLFDMFGDEDFLFPSKGTSLTINPGSKETIFASFSPKEVIGDGNRKATIKVSVLNNPYDQYNIQLLASAYSCDATFKTNFNEISSSIEEEEVQNDIVTFPDINLVNGEGQSSQNILICSQSSEPVKFELKLGPNVPDVLKFSPSTGHLDAKGSREINITFTTSKPITLNKSAVSCVLKRIQYITTDVDEESKALWGSWDDAMKSKRAATPEDIDIINKAAKELEDYNKNAAAELAKGKKGKPVGPPPPKCLLELVPIEEDGIQNVFEIVSEPKFEFVANTPQQELTLMCNGFADVAKFSCKGNGENITFNPTFLFQSTIYKFEFKNESNIKMPVKWTFEDMKQRRAPTRQSGGILSRIGTAAINVPAQNIPCPYSIEPEEFEVEPNATKQFTMKFSPLEVDDFMYLLKGTTLTSTSASSINKGSEEGLPSEVKMVVRGTAKRPICHFDVVETLDYMSRRPLNMKNENGLNSPIEVTDIKVVELESIGLQTRNTFRFYITNPTSDNYEFIWEALGEASPFWRCVQGAGMMFAGKRIEIVFEYLPEEVNVAEAFFKFRIPKVSLEQIFLFTGKVTEPKVFFSTSKIDFHSVMLGGEGSNDTIYLENTEHMPFHFAIDKYSLLQLDGPKRPILEISPKEGTVPPNGKIAINLFFHPQEEVLYNFNIICGVKRKPNKLTLNVKGEGYAVHPFIQLEQSQEMAESAGAIAKGGAVNRYLTLRPAPAINYADFGAVQVHDTITKSLTVTNNGKFNFDYVWDIDSISPMLTLSGGKLGGTLLKAEELNYKITFAPNHEGNLDGSLICFTVAGKYAYNIIPRGSGVKPALRFSFMQHDFSACFVTSPGGSTVVEEALLRITNHDPLSNIAIECTFQKTRALWAECPPTVIAPGGMIDVPIRFAPREVKDYAFVIPFIVNGSSKIPVNIIGSGINPRLELVNGSQRRTNFGVVNVDSSSSRTVAIINKSKKALPVQLIEQGDEYGSGNLSDHCISFSPKGEFVIAPKEAVSIQLLFNPTKRISQFAEDLFIRYAGITKTLLNVSGKSQGTEITLDSDSLPFGTVVLDSQKIKKLSLENTGDLTITFQWISSSFGQHFSISPLSGKILPGGEISFDVIFKPKFADDDIRQDNMMLVIPGLDPLKLTCTGSCIIPPTDNIQTLEFKSLARKAQEKTVKVQNPTDKDWYLSPSLQGSDWKIPHEFKVPAKGTADIPVTYYPLTMLNASSTSEEKSHKGQLFIALPDGSAQLYKLKGEADAPECSGQYTIETPAKKAATVILKVNNWLNDTQRFDVSVNVSDKPTPATFIVAANVTEIASNGTKEFPLRFISYTEGNSKGRVTFTNPITKEYSYYEIIAKTTMAEVQENIFIESPVRQTARYIITIENPLLKDQIPISMGSIAKPTEWWTCDSPYVKLNELTPLNGNIEGTFEVEYRPLKPTLQPTDSLLTIITKELGTFKYKVTLKATPPLLKQVLRFNASLGSMQTESFIFRSYNTVKNDYTCSVKKPEYFQVQSKLEVPPVQGGWNGDDIRLNVVFEPSIIGEIRDTLIVTSADGGEYICELIGSCTAPLPQGPFNLIQGAGGVDIPFRNCFSTSATWSFSIDSNAFRITAPTGIATVNGKTQSQCSIVFEPKEQHLALYPTGGFINAKLFITCTSIPNIPPWIFYLKGQIDLNVPLAGAGGAKKK